MLICLTVIIAISKCFTVHKINHGYIYIIFWTLTKVYMPCIQITQWLRPDNALSRLESQPGGWVSGIDDVYTV